MITLRPGNDIYTPDYLDLVPDGDLLEIHKVQMKDLSRLLLALSEDAATYRYDAGKWSIKEVIGHLVDTERVMSCRMLRAARGDKTSWASFDEVTYVAAGEFAKKTVSQLNEEWVSARESTISLLASLSPEALQNSGQFKGRETSALTVACIIVGHVRHHINILYDRYNIDPRH